jgi:glycosyltransferase involved in cell wall biosynthesis
MKILIVSTELEEQARGITGIIKSIVTAAKEAGHEVGVLVGYPGGAMKDHEQLHNKVEHIYLQHYLQNGKRDLFPPNMRGKRTLAQIFLGRSYLKHSHMDVQQQLVVDDRNLARKLDYIVKIPYAYHFINHGLPSVPKQVLRKAIKKYGIDLIITGAPMDLTRNEVAPAKLVQFVHDTMPLDMLETPADNRTPEKFARQLYATATGSDLILANSQDTARKVLEVNPNANVHVVYGTASSKASQFTDTSFLQRKGLTKDNFLLFISVIEKRKNIERLMDAYMNAYPEINMPLVIVGGHGYGYDEIMKHHADLPKKIKRNVIFTGFVSEVDKYALLNNARAFVWPTLYEGIGLPIVEAFCSNLPVLTSRRGALPEAGGSAALYIDNPYSVEQIKEGIVRITKDEKLRAELRSHIPEQLAKFTPEKFNERFQQALKKLDHKAGARIR